jgi:uncharacterized protein (TIGR00255 family)
MAVFSMTGYASAQGFGPSVTTASNSQSPASLHVDVRSVNSRFLDLSLKIPEESKHLETALRELVTKRIKRGKLELRINIVREKRPVLATPKLEFLQQLAEQQAKVLEQFPQASVLSVAEVLRMNEGANTAPEGLDAASSELLLQLAAQTCTALTEARGREGERLAQALLERLQGLRALTALAIPLVPQLVEQQRSRFLERWREAMSITGAPAQNAEERALAEAAAFAIRLDVAEEISRLQSHLDEIERLLKAGGEVGKRLDFLIQELHREANTLGSKSALLEMTRISMDMKVLIEQMREQVQNIE